MLLFGIFGGLLTFAGLAGGVLFPYALGMSLLFFGAALLGRFLHLPERPLFTGIGLVLLTFWTLTAGQITPSPGGGGPEMFVLSGVVMVAAASFVLVYNADLFLVIAATLGARSARILPALRTAIAYPMASKFRTGMTLAMIALVVFALTMMSVMNANFNRLFLDEDNFGGWDIQVTENPNNDLPGGLVSALQSTGADVDTDAFQAVGSLAVAPPGRWELCQPDASDCTDPEERRLYIVKGGDSTFFEESTMPLQARAEGYGTDEEVWRDIARSPDLAVIDSSALGGDFFDFGGQGDFFRLQGFGTDVTSFEPFEINVYDSNGEGEATVRVIGITSQGAAGGGDPFAAFFGLITRREVVQEVLGEIPQTNYFVRLEDDGTAEDVAHGIEASLLSLGAQAVSLEQERQEESALFNSFFYLMQAFAGLGLFVGIAAVGVVAFRSVVERRQQIGMLRAIGFNRRMVALSFVMESAFISMLGVLSGIGLAILLASFLLRSDEFAATGITSIVYPWERILLIGVFALIATFVMTFIPARQASSVPIAEALRYE
jgi:putative ABC transport system permease protein